MKIMEIKPNITDFSHELLCHIMKYLPLREILSVAMLSRKMLAAVNMHLQLCKNIDFCQDSNFGYMPSTITDDHLLTLMKKCPHLEIVYGLHPVKIERRRLRKRAALTIPGIIEALSLCFHLKAIETSDLRLFEAIMQHLPQLEIIGHFQNRNGLFPPQASQRLKLQPYPRISSLHLIGVEVPELTAMPHLQHLHLQCVRFTKLQPFRAFLAQNLKSFVMKHCIGPSVPQRYLSLIIALSSSPNLSHLELVRVPLLNGLFQRAVEDSYRHNGFVHLRTLVISGCKGILEADLGHLMIVASKNLETLYIQPSLTKDSLFVSLSFAQCSFPVLQNLHLGYIDNLNFSGEWSNDTLLSFGLAEVPDTPSSLTDSGMKVISQLFHNIKTLSVSNCPHLMVMYQWKSELDNDAWSRLTDLTLQKCHCLQLSSFVHFISQLSNIQVVILSDMFREPPKGCSHVGLSAGTGLGMSSAVVSNQDEHIAVQGHHQEFEPPGDEENEEIDREFAEAENEDNPEPQFMVLQRDFFDGEDNHGAVDNPSLENDQDPIVEDQGLNITFNEVNNNSLPNENIVISHENDILDNSLSSSSSKVKNQSVTCENQSLEVSDELEYCSKNTKKKFKSSNPDCIQDDILSQDNCRSTNFKEEKNSIINDTYNSDGYILESNNKISTESESLLEYDPYKPSTSKAGSHLDYSDWGDEHKSSKGTKRSNMCLNDENVSKNKKESPKDRGRKGKYNKISPNNSFENSKKMCNEFKDEDYSNSVKKKLLENVSCDAKINSNRNPVSFNIDKIPTTMQSCSPVKEEEIENKAKIDISQVESEDNKALKVDKDELSVPCCDNNKDKNMLNNIKKNECVHAMPLKNSDADIYSEQCYSYLEDIKECLCLNSDEFDNNCQSSTTLKNCSSEINETQINKSMHKTTISKSNQNISLNSFSESDINFTDSLSEKKFDTNNVCELSEHEILLKGSINEPTEETVHKVEVNTIATVTADKLDCCVDENSLVSRTEDNLLKKKNLTNQFPSVIIYNNAATQTCKNDFDDNDLNIKQSSLHESKICPTKKSLATFKSDMHKSDENLFANENSLKTSEKLKVIESLDSSNIIKPCCVLITKIENVDCYLEKYSKDGNKMHPEKTPHDNSFEQANSDYFPALNEDENSSKRKKSGMCNPALPSTSKAETDTCNASRKHSKTFKKMHTLKYFKTSSTINTRSKNVNCCTVKESSKHNLKCSSASETKRIKNSVSTSQNEISKCNSEDPSEDLNELKKSPKIGFSGDNCEDSKFYVINSVPTDGTFKIFNSISGKSYQIPQCQVVVTPINNKRSNDLQERSKYKNRQKHLSQKSCVKRYDNNVEFNPYLPSTSRAGNDLSNSFEDVPYLNNKFKTHKKALSHTKCFECKNLNKCYCNCFNTEKLHIKNSDAMILLKQSCTKKYNKYVPHQQKLCELDTNDKSKFENEPHNSCLEETFANRSNPVPFSENTSHVCKDSDDNITFGNTESASSLKKKQNSGSRFQRKRKRRKIIISFKRVKKSSNDYKVKINNSFQDSAKTNLKRPSVPMISVISQGTQATSADIRRSVRRIRRAVTHRRTMLSCMSKGRHSSKISAKIVTKKPISMSPRPESYDKATSTSDPLLEDDAVQTLELSSPTLVSFTMVSCGISDLIIDQCIKLFHIEVQACRILKSFQFNNCPAVKRLNVSQCPKLNISALASPVMSLSTDSYFLVSYEPCMQGYHPGEGEKAILAKASTNQSVLLLHDFCDISYDSIQGKFREKILGWLHFLLQLHLCLNYTQEKLKRKKYKSEVYQLSEYPWSHDLRRLHGHYSYSSSDFCNTEGRYQLLTNNPIFCDIFETNQVDTEFPDIADCVASKDLSLLSCEVIEKYLEMQKKFVAFYIPVTESNQVNF